MVGVAEALGLLDQLVDKAVAEVERAAVALVGTVAAAVAVAAAEMVVAKEVLPEAAAMVELVALRA